MGEPIQAAYQPPEIPEKLLNSVAEIGLTKDELKAIAQKDPCFLRLQVKLQNLKAKPVADCFQIQDLWKEVVKAYWNWINARLDKEERTEQIKVTEGQMRRRLIELRKRETLKRVTDVQRKLGYRFSPGMNSGGRPRAEDALPSATTTSGGQ